MRSIHIVIFALVAIGISAKELDDPAPCHSDHGSSSNNGQAGCATSFSKSSIKTLSYESAIETIVSTTPVLSFAQLAQHVINFSEQALGYSAILSDETLADIAWIFRLRHMPEPVVFTRSSTRYDAARLVRFILTNEEVMKAHHFSEEKINELISAVELSVQQPNSFVFRMIEAQDSEYHQIGVHQLTSRMHYFAAVHTEDQLQVGFVGSEAMGQFIKGHGGMDAIQEREEGAQFLRQWLLNQWVNMWTCTNPDL